MAVILVVSWVGAITVLSPDRGLDLTDEGLYLLEASVDDPSAAWGTPYGWFTHPMLDLVGRDVAAFRTLGAVLLGLASAMLALEAFRLGASLRDEVGDAAKPWGWPALLGQGSAVTAGLLGALLYYSGFLRTPSYNWVTIIGATVAMAGFLRLIRAESRASRGDGLLGGRLLAVTTTSFGLFVTVFAKPTTPILFAPIAFLILERQSGLRQALRLLAVVTASSFGWVAAALLVGMWPQDFLEVFLRAATNPTPSEVQSLVGATVAFIRTPVDALIGEPLLGLLLPAIFLPFAADLRDAGPGASVVLDPPPRTVRRVAVALGVGAAATALIWVVAPPIASGLLAAASGLLDRVLEGRSPIGFGSYVDRLRTNVTGIGPGAGGLLATVIALRRGITGGALRAAGLLALGVAAVVLLRAPGALFGLEPAARFASRDTTTVLLALSGAAWALTAGRTPSRRRPDLMLVAGALLAMAFVTGFGSGHQPYRQASLAAPLLVGGLVLVLAAVSWTRSRWPVVGVGALLVALVLQNMADSRARPYRAAEVSVSVVPTQVGVDGAELLLDPERAEFLRSLLSAAVAADWREGTPLLGVTKWPSTLVWHLGGATPESVMPTLRFRSDRFDLTLSALDPEEWRDAWILLEGEGDAEARTSAIELATRFSLRVGRPFPSGYEKVWSGAVNGDQYARAELWRPRS